MKKITVIVSAALGAVLLLSAGGAAAWWHLQPKDPVAEAAKAAEAAAKIDYKYVSLDKVIVMLRSGSGEPMSHYLAVDLVFKTAVDTERVTKDHLPLLRSVAVKALSQHTMQSAGNLSIDQFATEINDAYDKSYAADHREKPFAEALIGKLIIE